MGISLLLRKRKTASQVRVKVTITCICPWPVVEIQMERLFGAFFLQLCHLWKWQVPALKGTLLFVFSSQYLLPTVPSCVRDFWCCSAIKHYQFLKSKALICTFVGRIRTKISLGELLCITFYRFQPLTVGEKNLNQSKLWSEEPKAGNSLIYFLNGTLIQPETSVLMIVILN